MKKHVFISIIMILILLVGSSVAYAASPSVSASGENKVKAGETGTVTINVTSGDSKAGVVSGKIVADAKISSLKAVGINDWTLTYNETTGDFNAVKAAGATADTESLITITYTIKSDASDKATITLSDLKVTGIDYTQESVSNVTKEIAIEATKQEAEIAPAGGTTTTPSSSTTNSKTVDTSTAKTKMPQTGESSILILGAVVVVAIIGTVAYVKYKRTY